MILSCGAYCHTNTIGIRTMFVGVLPAMIWLSRTSMFAICIAHAPSDTAQVHLPLLQSWKHSTMPPTGTLSTRRSIPTYHDSSHSSPLRRPLRRSYCYSRVTLIEESRYHRSLLRRTSHIQHRRSRHFPCSFGLHFEETRLGSHLP